MDPDIHEREERLLKANLMGDIRDDVEFLGLNLLDVVWIIGNSLIFGLLFSYVLPFQGWAKVIWILLVFIFNLISRFRKWPYRRKRYIRDLRTKREGSGEDFETLLNIKEDSWFYRSGRVVHIISELNAPPWQTAIYAQKKRRLAYFENFLRGLVREGFKASITSEKVPDFRLDLWNRKRQEPAASEGIHNLRLGRVELWEHLAVNGEAQRSEYHLTLSIDEHRVTLREQDGETPEMKPADIKKHRFMAGIREKYERIILNLHSSGHDTTLMSGYSVTELMARWWDRRSWEDWKMNDGRWDDPEVSETEPVSIKENQVEDQKEKKEKEITLNPEVEATSIENAKEDHLNEKSNDDEDTIFTALQAVTNEKVSKHSLKKKRVNMSRVVALIIKIKGLLRVFQLRSAKIIKKVSAKLSRLVSGLREKVITTDKKMKKDEVKNEDKNQKIENVGISEIEQVPTFSTCSTEFEQKALLFTAPTSTGKTFLAANVAAAVGSSGIRVTLIDLAKDRGTLTVLNPVQLPCEMDGWEKWESRHVPNLQIICPIQYPSIHEVRKIINAHYLQGAVIVDLPWAYPGREGLAQDYELIGIMDCDYHHWLQWESLVSSWSGKLWINQCDSEMKKRMSQLIKEKYSLTFEHEFPYFKAANKYLFQGRPLALETHARSSFCFTGMEESQCSPIPSEL